MKKRIFRSYAMISVCSLPLLFAACENDLDEKWLNPMQFTPSEDQVASGLLTTMQFSNMWRYFAHYYYNTSWPEGIQQIIQVSGGNIPMSTQSSTTLVDNNYYDLIYLTGGEPETGDLSKFAETGNQTGMFNTFYNESKNYGLIRDLVNGLSGSDRADNEFYLQCATVLKNIGALKTVDKFNSIPYFNALRGSEGVFKAEYDDPAEIYKSAILELQQISAQMRATHAAMSDKAKQVLAKQDVWFNGDVDKWVRFVNGEILRYTLRASGVTITGLNTATVIAAAIAGGTILDGAEDYTMIPEELNQVYENGQRDGDNGRVASRYLGGCWYAWAAAPDGMITRMNHNSVKYEPGTDDPRLKVIFSGFTPTGNANDVEYYGSSWNRARNKKVIRGEIATETPRFFRYPYDSLRYTTRLLRPYSVTLDQYVKGAGWATYNPITFVLLNPYYELLQTRAEIDLILAECVMKGYASVKPAADLVKDAVVHSCEFWYKLNNGTYNAISGGSSQLAKDILQPAINMTDVETYSNYIKNEFAALSGEDAMEMLMQQKYIHLNMGKWDELSAELRRTRHPKLEPLTWEIGSTGQFHNNIKYTFERYKYPESQKSTNKEAYSRVQDQDNWTTPIFWCICASESYYMDRALKD